MNLIEYTTLAFLLFKRVLETIKSRGFITRREKMQIFRSIQFLTGGVLDEARKSSKLLGEL